jgi:hypothetical protein
VQPGAAGCRGVTDGELQYRAVMYEHMMPRLQWAICVLSHIAIWPQELDDTPYFAGLASTVPSTGGLGYMHCLQRGSAAQFLRQGSRFY